MPTEAGLRQGATRDNACRLFIGNLPSEQTNESDLRKIFGVHGKVVEIVIRRSFGFIQFEKPEEAQAALKAENGRKIGTCALDISLADDRPRRATRNGPATSSSSSHRHSSRSRSRSKSKSRSRSPNGHRNKKKKSKSRSRSHSRSRSRSRSPSVTKHSTGSSSSSKIGGPSSNPNGNRVQILIVGSSTVRKYGERVGREILRSTHLENELVSLERREVEAFLRKCEQQRVRYALVIGKEDEAKSTVALNILRNGLLGQTQGFESINYVEAVDLIARQEAMLKLSAPPHPFLQQQQRPMVPPQAGPVSVSVPVPVPVPVTVPRQMMPLAVPMMSPSPYGLMGVQPAVAFIDQPSQPIPQMVSPAQMMYVPPAPIPQSQPQPQPLPLPPPQPSMSMNVPPPPQPYFYMQPQQQGPMQQMPQQPPRPIIQHLQPPPPPPPQQGWEMPTAAATNGVGPPILGYPQPQQIQQSMMNPTVAPQQPPQPPPPPIDDLFSKLRSVGLTSDSLRSLSMMAAAAVSGTNNSKPSGPDEEYVPYPAVPPQQQQPRPIFPPRQF